LRLRLAWDLALGGVGLDAVGLNLLLADLLADLLLVGDGLTNPSCRLETDDSGRLAAALAARHLLDAARLAFDDSEVTVAERGGTLVVTARRSRAVQNRT
jgi:hypothetical protein